MQQQSSSLSPIGNRVMRVPAGASQAAAANNNSQQSSSGLNLSVRENLNKSQNITMPTGANNAYAPQQLL